MPRGDKVKTKGKMILAWREVESGVPREEVAKKYKVAPRTIGVWRTAVRKDKRLMEIAQSGRRVSVNMNDLSSVNAPSIKISAKTADLLLNKTGNSRYKELEDEIKFLRWWNIGERLGYVDRLLKQIQD